MKVEFDNGQPRPQDWQVKSFVQGDGSWIFYPMIVNVINDNYIDFTNSGLGLDDLKHIATIISFMRKDK